MVTKLPYRGKVDKESKPVFEFLAVTGLPNDGESRRIVRSHAIRDANRRKFATQGNQDAAPRKAGGKALPQATFTTKFRLNGKSTRKTVVPKETVKKNTNGLDENADNNILPLTGSLKTINRQRKSVLAISSLEQFDPFDSLPIKIGSKQSALLHYRGFLQLDIRNEYLTDYKSENSALTQNAFAFYSKERLFSYASADAAWLNATLCLISLHYDLKLGKGISRDSLFHRGEALRIVNERLKASPEDVSDSTIGAIASLANFDTTNGLFPSATMHVRGLVSIISNRGDLKQGLLALEGNELLQKIVAWSDLSYSTTWDLVPQFPLLKTDYCQAELAEFLDVLLPHLPVSTNLFSPHDLFGEMTDIFQTLRLLTIIMTTPNVSPEVQALFTRGLYITEYKLLVVLDQSDPGDDITLDRNSQIYGSTRLAAYLYLYLMLRELPQTANICTNLARRLKGILSGVGFSDLLGVWYDDLHLLNWIAFMGALAMKGTGDEEYFIEILRRLQGSLVLDLEWMFRNALREVLWIDDPCWETGCSDIWKKLDTIPIPTA